VAVTSEPGGDIAHGEIVENELDRLIRKRHDRRVAEEGERPERVAWTESERRYDARRRAENRAAWYGWQWTRPSATGATSPPWWPNTRPRPRG
jgi:hypothetical protein